MTQTGNDGEARLCLQDQPQRLGLEQSAMHFKVRRVVVAAATGALYTIAVPGFSRGCEAKPLTCVL
jgi:hypothetical protein